MLHLYQSNRLEILLDLLAAVVEQPLDSALARETVIVQSKGMGRWISLRLAEKHGICANIDFPLPASFMWQLLCEIIGNLPQRSAYAPEVLTWRLMDWLNEPEKLEQAPRLNRYLRVGDDLRRFELASRIADVFDQYLVFRPDWLNAWEQGRLMDLGADEEWQARLWRDLAAGNTQSHRAQLALQLVQHLRDTEHIDRLPERLVLFGISSLPPVFLDVIKALANRIDVCLFALNPCREAWGEIHDSHEISRLSADAPSEELYLEVGNPLLASLGKQGREFFDSLLAEFPEVHSLFDDAHPACPSILQTIQADVLNLRDRNQSGMQTVPANDRSLQIHVCHSPMREVEVLRDQILALLDADPNLEPGDIAVLTPDISLYSPFIEAAFGAREGETFIPYSIADRNLSSEQPILESFLRLLNLPTSRFEAEWVLDFLQQPAIRRRFDLAEDDIPTVHGRVRDAAIRWGRDAAHKACLGLPAEPRHTWRDGLNRLLLGYALPKTIAGDGIPLFGSTLPYDDVEGAIAITLGRFAEFVETLMYFSTKLATDRPLSIPQSDAQHQEPGELFGWTDTLYEMIERLFLPADEEIPVIQQLRDTLDLLAELAANAGFDKPVSHRVASSWLTKQLRQTHGSSGFLTGGVTFCTMVPMRCLPFKVICLLGLNDDAFPRQQRSPGFDLIAGNPRRGDRSRRLDDRYLFLETILSARQTLYLSYVGRSIRDHGELPPSVLVADLLDVVRASCRLDDGGDCLEQVITEHPLQPFNPVYFCGDAMRPGFSERWLDAARLLGTGEHELPPLFSGSLPEPEPEWRSVDLQELIYFYSNPARYLLRRRLGLVLETDETVFENREPFELDYFGRDSLRHLALEGLRRAVPAETAKRLAEASGLLPHGDFGLTLFARELGLVEKVAPALLPILTTTPLEPLPLRLETTDMMLNGFLTGVVPQGLVDFSLQTPGPRDLFALWVRHLALCLLEPEGVVLESRLLGVNKTVVFTAVAQPEPLMTQLLTYYLEGLRRPLPFFIKSAWAYAEAEPKKGPQQALLAAHAKWDTGQSQQNNSVGESQSPWYQAIYRGWDPLDGEFQTIALDILTPLQANLTEG